MKTKEFSLDFLSKAQKEEFNLITEYFKYLNEEKIINTLNFLNFNISDFDIEKDYEDLAINFYKKLRWELFINIECTNQYSFLVPVIIRDILIYKNIILEKCNICDDIMIINLDTGDAITEGKFGEEYFPEEDSILYNEGCFEPICSNCYENDYYNSYRFIIQDEQIGYIGDVIANIEMIDTNLIEDILTKSENHYFNICRKWFDIIKNSIYNEEKEDLYIEILENLYKVVNGSNYISSPSAFFPKEYTKDIARVVFRYLRKNNQLCEIEEARDWLTDKKGEF